MNGAKRTDELQSKFYNDCVTFWSMRGKTPEEARMLALEDCKRAANKSTLSY